LYGRSGGPSCGERLGSIGRAPLNVDDSLHRHWRRRSGGRGGRWSLRRRPGNGRCRRLLRGRLVERIGLERGPRRRAIVGRRGGHVGRGILRKRVRVGSAGGSSPLLKRRENKLILAPRWNHTPPTAAYEVRKAPRSPEGCRLAGPKEHITRALFWDIAAVASSRATTDMPRRCVVSRYEGRNLLDIWGRNVAARDPALQPM
jgi:hypothetical protein